jgi:hypothetical protein
VRRRLAWLAGVLVLAGVAVYRTLAGTPRTSEPLPVVPDPRAEELRRKLAESRATDTTAEPEAEPAAPEVPVADEAETPEGRRRAVHEHGRAAAEKMRSPVDEGGHE